MNGDDPRQLNVAVNVGGPPAGYVVRDVGSGAVAGKEAHREISHVKELLKETVVRLPTVEKAEDVHAVVVLCGETVLGREAVVDRDDRDAELPAEAAAHGVALDGAG